MGRNNSTKTTGIIWTTTKRRLRRDARKCNRSKTDTALCFATEKTLMFLTLHIVITEYHGPLIGQINLVIIREPTRSPNRRLILTEPTNLEGEQVASIVRRNCIILKTYQEGEEDFSPVRRDSPAKLQSANPEHSVSDAIRATEGETHDALPILRETGRTECSDGFRGLILLSSLYCRSRFGTQEGQYAGAA